VGKLNISFKKQIVEEMKNMIGILSKPIEGSQFGCTETSLASDEERESWPNWLWDSNTNRVVACPEVKSSLLG